MAERINWSVLIRRFWPASLRAIMNGYIYVPKSVFKSTEGTLILWCNKDDIEKSLNPPYWWELRNNEGILVDTYAEKGRPSSPPFKWAQATLLSFGKHEKIS